MRTRADARLIVRVLGCRLLSGYYKAYSSSVGKTKRNQQAIYLDQKKAALLARLSRQTGVPKQHYFREAVDRLLAEYGLLKPRRGRDG